MLPGVKIEYNTRIWYVLLTIAVLWQIQSHANFEFWSYNTQVALAWNSGDQSTVLLARLPALLFILTHAQCFSWSSLWIFSKWASSTERLVPACSYRQPRFHSCVQVSVLWCFASPSRVALLPQRLAYASHPFATELHWDYTNSAFKSDPGPTRRVRWLKGALCYEDMPVICGVHI